MEKDSCPQGTQNESTFLTGSDKLLCIKDGYICFNETRVSISGLTGIRFGAVKQIFHALLIRDVYILCFEADADFFTIKFRSSFVTADRKEKEQLYNNILTALWEAGLRNRIIAYLDKINRGGAVSIDECVVLPAGPVVWVYSGWKRQRSFIPWDECVLKSENGFMYLFSSRTKKFKYRASFLKTKNAVLLYVLVSQLLKKQSCFRENQ